VQLHLLIELNHFVQYFLDLALLALELAKLLIKAVNQPYSSLVQLISILVLAVPSDHGNIKMFDTQKLQNFKYFADHFVLASDKLRVFLTKFSRKTG